MAITSMLFSLVVVTAMVANGLAAFSWRVRVVTGQQESAGTNDKVFIRLLQGSKKSLFYNLNNQQNSFQRGATDDFNLRLKDFGEPDTIMVYKLKTDRWFVSWIELRRQDKRDKIYYFPCHRWLVGTETEIFGLLGPGQKPYCDWRVVTYTGKKRYSSTGDPVFISVYGNNEWTAVYELNSPKNDFEWSAKDEFSFRSKCITPTRIKAVLEGTDGWFLSRIELHRKDDTKKAYIFHFHFMLDNHETKDINVLNPHGEPLCKWYVNVWTGHQQHAGTQGIVYIQLFGSDRKTGVYELPHSFHRYKEGAQDFFHLETICLIPTKIAVTLEGNDNWFLYRIQLQKSYNINAKYIFPLHDWVGEGDTRNIDVWSSTNRSYCLWLVEVWTNSRKYAGTNDEVRIKIFGNGTWTSSYKLNSRKNDFERGAADKFDLQSKCLTPTKITVKLTGDDGWYLNEIKVTNKDKEDKGYIFLCDCWLDNSEEKILPVKP